MNTIFEDRKYYDCQKMPDELKEEFIAYCDYCLDIENYTIIKWNCILEIEEEDYNIVRNKVTKWFLENGANISEGILINCNW